MVSKKLTLKTVSEKLGVSLALIKKFSREHPESVKDFTTVEQWEDFLKNNRVIQSDNTLAELRRHQLVLKNEEQRLKNEKLKAKLISKEEVGEFLPKLINQIFSSIYHYDVTKLAGYDSVKLSQIWQSEINKLSKDTQEKLIKWIQDFS